MKIFSCPGGQKSLHATSSRSWDRPEHTSKRDGSLQTQPTEATVNSSHTARWWTAPAGQILLIGPQKRRLTSAHPTQGSTFPGWTLAPSSLAPRFVKQGKSCTLTPESRSLSSPSPEPHEIVQHREPHTSASVVGLEFLLPQPPSSRPGNPAAVATNNKGRDIRGPKNLLI